MLNVDRCKLLFLLALAFLLASLPNTARAQNCSGCMSLTPINNVPVYGVAGGSRDIYDPTLTPASTGASYTHITISQVATPIPNLPVGTYPAWCATSDHDNVGNANFTATTVGLPAPYSSPVTTPSNGATVMTEVNYVLNRKQGTVADVQLALWTVVGSLHRADIIGYTNAVAMYDAAVANATGRSPYTPAPGDIVAVLFLAPSGSGTQNFFIEVVNCSRIGDLFWLDGNNNGIQDADEPGINGVTVSLRNLTTNQIVATTVTGPSPINYPYLPYTSSGGTPGYYQFTGFCADNYQVEFSLSQTALANVVPTKTLVDGGASSTTDSNPNPDAVTIPANLNPYVDETNDFGFVGVAPLTLNCPTGTGQVAVGYTGSVNPAGGVTPYTFSVTSGSLPPGLTLNTTTGAITGTPTTAGTFSFTIQVTDSATPAHTQSVSCTIIISPSPIGLRCAATSGQVGVAYTSGMTATGGDGNYTFSIVSGSLPPGLGMNASTGVITGTPTAAGTFSFQVSVHDGTGTSAGTTTTSCTITIIPANLTLLCPATSGAVGNAYSSRLTAQGGSGTYTFAINSGAIPPGLTLNASTGLISGTPTTAGTFTFTAQVTDGTGATATTATANCTITITPPLVIKCPGATAFVGVSYTGAITVTGGSNHFSYAVTNGSLPAGLTLNPTTGAITGAPTTAGTANFTIQVTDLDTKAVVTSNCAITVYVPPTLACMPQTVGVTGTPYSASIVTTNGSGNFFYSIINGNLPAGLSLNSSTGAITGTPTAAGSFTFTVQVTDGQTGISVAMASTACTITITTPLTLTCASLYGVTGTAYSSSLSASGGTAPYTYAITNGSLPPGLTMNALGVISGIPTTAGTYTFTAQVTDSTGGAAQTKSTTCTMTITTPLTLTCASLYGVTGTSYSSSLSASGGTAPYTYAITNGTLPPGLTMNASGMLSGIPTTAGTYTFTAQATDSSGGTAQTKVTSCTMTITTPLTLTCASLYGVTGTAYSSSLSASGGTAPYTYAITSGSLPAGLSLNPSTGVISGIPTTAGTYTFTAQVTDSTGGAAQTKSTTCTMTITTPLALTCASLYGVTGTPYSSSLSASGGTAPYTYAITGGTLPPGLTMNASGLLSGTPTAAGTYTFTAQATDSSGGTAQTKVTSCTMTITTPLTLACPSANGEVGAPFSSALVATGGTPSYTYSILPGTLPAGLNLNASTGLISGTPTAAGTYTFTAQVTDSTGGVAQTTTTSCTITIAAKPSLACVAAGTGEVGTPFNAPAPAITGGAQPFTFSVGSGTMPTGLTLNTSTGAINGTPTASGSFTIQMVDGNGIVATGACPYTIAERPVIACTSTAVAEVGLSFNATVSVTGGVAPYKYAIAGGSVPAGLTFDLSTGVISGAPTAPGSFTVQVTDANGVVATGNCPYTIIAGPTMTCSGKAAGVVGYGFNSGAPAVSGGVTPYTFSISGTLAGGLTLNADGSVSGIPTTAGSFAVQVRDVNGAAAPGSCPITIAPPPVTNCASITAVEGTPITPVTLQASGGLGGPYVFTSTGLPQGLTMSTNGTITGTPLVNGTFAYTVTVTDTASGAASSISCTVVVAGDNMCGLTWGYWKNHNWPVWPASNGLYLGGVLYTPAQLNIILGTSVSGDASLNLAHQLIAAKLNVFNGTDVSTANGAIDAADALLAKYAPNTIPLGIDASSTDGAQMTNVAGQLDNFNSDGIAQPGCVNSPTSLTLACAASTGTVGLPYSSAVAASGGYAPYSYSITSGALPPGLTLDPATGKITGTPTQAGAFNFTVTATDSTYTGGKSGVVNSNCSITIAPEQLTVACPTAAAKVGEPYASASVTDGGTDPFTFFVMAGGLPPGLTLDPTSGAVRGTPTASGTYSFTIKVTDSGGQTATTSCNIIVAAATLAATCPAGTAQTTANYSSPVSATGGTAPYLFSLASGSLPPGLKLNASTGQISGVPSATGTFTFSVNVADSAGASVPTNCTITVSSPTGTISAGMFTTYTQGGWGANPKGNNAGMLLSKNFGAVYGAAGVTIGGTYKLTFTSANAVNVFLPQGGTATALKASAINPTATLGVLAGQTLTLQLSVNFSNTGITPTGLAALHVASGKMAGYTVAQVLSVANAVLGGTASALPAGMSISDLNSAVDSINNNFDGGTKNNGYLKY